MSKKTATRLPRRILRMIPLLLFGHPQVFVTVPLSIGLLLHVTMTLFREEPAHGFTPVELTKCVGVVAALVVFATLAIAHVIIVCYGILRRNGNGSQFHHRGPTETGQRLDAVITRKFLCDRIESMAQSRRIVGPVEHHEPACEPPRRYFYETIEKTEDLALDFNYCVYGPKSVVLPSHETLLSFNRSNGRFDASHCIDASPVALIGVHPCDLHALQTLDAAFSQHHPDDHYLSRRRNLFIVGVDCPRPCAAGVFCADLGAERADDGFDVMLYPIDAFDRPTEAVERYGVVFGSDAGRAWLEPNEESTAGAIENDSDNALFDAYLAAKWKAFPSLLEVERDAIPTVLRRSYDSLLWSATAERCYSCGSCNLVCPTCYCFDIQDENELPLTAGHRARCWDGCMLRDFSLVAGDHNFRARSAERLRHRIFRKGAWIADRTGRMGCVGCGRCDRACTAQISIVQILNQLSEEAHHDQDASLV